jgi:alkanesulfonate monooxygenase SsuD/methylene tetrahydromethanopterin reductase-like flavin-dependent oxidoreductase (luciferase family)
MQYALALPNGGECGDPRILADLARLAEASGWDAVFLEDYICYTNDTYHSLPGAPTYDPWVALAAMALHTERVRLGTSVTPLPRRRPWKLAREAVTLDHLSHGRLILGVGSGDAREQGFSRVGEVVDARQRAEMLDEGLDILVGLWSGQPFSYTGKHYAIDMKSSAFDPYLRVEDMAGVVQSVDGDVEGHAHFLGCWSARFARDAAGSIGLTRHEHLEFCENLLIQTEEDGLGAAKNRRWDIHHSAACRCE